MRRTRPTSLQPQCQVLSLDPSPHLLCWTRLLCSQSLVIDSTELTLTWGSPFAGPQGQLLILQMTCTCGSGQGHSLRKDQVPPLSFPSYSPSATKAASRKAVPHECFSAFNPACYLRLCCQALHRAVPRKPSVQKPQDQSPHNCLHTCLLPPMMQAAHCRDSRGPGHHKGQWPGTTSMISQSLPRLALPSHLSFLSVFQSLL